jgi:catechol 2,3-dioxygenase-like lactoylglutathione lyase family enzyme
MDVSQPLVGDLAYTVFETANPVASIEFLERGLNFHTRQVGSTVEVYGTAHYGRETAAKVLELVPGETTQLREIVFSPAAESPTAPEAGEFEIETRADGFTVNFEELRISCRAVAESEVAALTPSPWRPTRLGHINFGGPNPLEAVDLMTQAFRLKLSEQVGDEFFFLRIRDEHHNIGIRSGQKWNAHHVAFELQGWEMYRILSDHLAAEGFRIEYGPGRHAPARSLFMYVCDPASGLRFELFAEMARIADERSYTPPKWKVGERPRTLNMWGGAPPPESFLNF